eukprot:1817285-Rhodomonas_salina.3
MSGTDMSDVRYCSRLAPTPCPVRTCPARVQAGTDLGFVVPQSAGAVSYTHLRAHETEADL